MQLEKTGPSAFKVYIYNYYGGAQRTKSEGGRPRGPLLTQKLKVRVRKTVQVGHAITHFPASLSLPQVLNSLELWLCLYCRGAVLRNYGGESGRSQLFSVRELEHFSELLDKSISLIQWTKRTSVLQVFPTLEKERDGEAGGFPLRRNQRRSKEEEGGAAL